MRSIGVIILCFFAAIWWAWGISNSAVPFWPCAVTGLCLSVGLAALSMQAARGTPPLPSSDQRRIGRLVGWASATEGVAILAAVNLFNWLNIQEYFVCACAAIVALHFIPLARMPQASIYNVTALAMLSLAATGAWLAWPLRGAVVASGTAIVLWATCVYIIAAIRHKRTSSPLSSPSLVA